MNQLFYPPIDCMLRKYKCNLSPLKISISYFEGRKHLPIIEIKNAS
jgi:hypothetical protein